MKKKELELFKVLMEDLFKSVVPLFALYADEIALKKYGKPEEVRGVLNKLSNMKFGDHRANSLALRVFMLDDLGDSVKNFEEDFPYIENRPDLVYWAFQESQAIFYLDCLWFEYRDTKFLIDWIFTKAFSYPTQMMLCYEILKREKGELYELVGKAGISGALEKGIIEREKPGEGLKN